MKAAAIILSGGKSSRMGTNKALLKLNEKTTIERMVDSLKIYFDDIILVTNDLETYQFLGVKMVSDHYPGKGPLAGFHAGLRASDCDVNFITACDMPFMSGELASTLVGMIDHHDALVPVINGKMQTLCAVFHKKSVNRIEECIENGRLPIKHLLDHLNVLYVTEKELEAYSSVDMERVFFNMNHPHDYEDAKKWLETGR
ncbi:molybdenum cofactor guanylyltransferase [Neobacillus sp. CF12]|uniref:molybdenum cofactor guanylyltransferase n=1 Tax=Neobacillus sp. CF12 TaxID=3055864 RepID=UPI0025A1913D|nr:molybdenum cofactor guanylyltransferase [Neobacillus sp. CF12]MDM5329640.1 molybdenum cofactor guanylyltransferase [Neobacillus sp. CF12]